MIQIVPIIYTWGVGGKTLNKGENTMYKIIACDLDETLLNDNREISKENKEAIAKAKALGVKFVPSTGRAFNTVDDTLKELELYDAVDEYIISFNGGAITENKGNKLLHFQGISFDLASELFKRGIKYDVCIHVYTIDKVYIYRYIDEEREYLEGRMQIIEFFTPDIEFLKGQEIVKVIYMNKDYDYLKQIEEAYVDLKDQIDISYSSNRYIEFNHKGVSKGQGLLSLANLLDVNIKDTIAIGDNFNDLSMIQMAGLGVGVKNAAEGIKSDCNYITSSTNNESAIAEVIEKFILNEK